MAKTTTIKGRDAPEALAQNEAEVLALLDDIRREVALTVARGKADPKNWGYVGNLGYTFEQLRDVREFLANRDR